MTPLVRIGLVVPLRSEMACTLTGLTRHPQRGPAWSAAGRGHRSSVHLEAEGFDLMTKWIDRYRQRAEARYRWLDAVLREMDDDEEAGHRPARHATA